MRVLFLNWRDTANPAAGGAETFTEEIGRRLVALGNDVTIFTSSFDGCEPEAHRFGMRIIREGGKYSVYAKARGFVKHHLSEFDVIVDEINTVPFRIHTIAKGRPVIAVIHQLAREVWFHETWFPLNAIGYFALEPLWLRGYRRIPTVTVSKSTERDLLKLGFRHVRIVHNGISVAPLDELPQKETFPVIAYVGRLVNSKLPMHAIEAFHRISSQYPQSELWIIGEGYLRRNLERKAVRGVKFFGRVEEKRKHELLKRAHVVLAPSIREGWNITVIEANAMGTPVVGYSVPGLRDSIIDGVTGYLVEPRNAEALARAAMKLLLDRTIMEKFSKNAIEWSRNFDWDKAAREFLSALVDCANASTEL